MSSGSDNTPASAEHDDRLETVRFDAFVAVHGAIDPVVAMHLGIAERLLSEGSPARAFSELVRAARDAPMTPRLAGALVSVALRAGTVGVAVTVLNDALVPAETDLRRALRRALARLHRRSFSLEPAREQLVLRLAERPTDQAARRVLNALLEREERWEELDASLEKSTTEALRTGFHKRASHAALRRARLWAERLGDPSRAALRYGQAAQYAEAAGDPDATFVLRVLWLRMLRRAQSPGRALEEAYEATLRAGERVGRADRVRALAQELELDATASEATPFDDEHPTNRGTPPAEERRSTELEILAVAEEGARTASGPELAAVLQAAVEAKPDAASRQKLEAHYVARRAWRELAQLYRDAAVRAPERAEKVGWLEKLAELLESELDDAVGAARAWAEVAEVTGDPHAVKEQVRLHATQRDETAVRRALNEGVNHATLPLDRAAALVARAEDALTREDWASARADLTAALALAPGHLPALAGIAELEALGGELSASRTFEDALRKLPKRAKGRGELYRRLARLAEGPLDDQALGGTCWQQVLFELPEDPEAHGRLGSLAHAGGDVDHLESTLRARIQKEPRGPQTRLWRLELVRLLEAQGRGDVALEELKQAVRHEPGHQHAWLMYSERLRLRQKPGEAAWALEHAATATEDGDERVRLWRELASLVRTELADEERAGTYERRADKLRRELDEDRADSRPPESQLFTAPPSGRHAAYMPAIAHDFTPEGKTPLAPAEPQASPGRARKSQPLPAARAPIPKGPTVVPPPQLRASGARPALALPTDSPWPGRQGRDQAPAVMAPPLPLAPKPSMESQQRVEMPAPPPGEDDDWEGSTVGWQDDEAGDEVMELASSDLVLPDSELLVPPRPSPRSPPSSASASAADAEDERSTSEMLTPLGDPHVTIPPSGVSPALGKRAKEREQLFERVRRRPLEPEGFRALSDHFDACEESERAALMIEIARALEGDPESVPKSPRLILSATDRAGLKHPALRGDAGELLGLSGLGLCRIFPTRGDASGSGREFHLESGKGAKACADALLVGVRVLGVRAPEVHLSHDNGPPFSCVFPGAPRLLVGRLAVKRELPPAELRFFAGRALFTQSPDLLALRTLRKEQLARSLQVLTMVLRGQALSAEARVMRDALPPKTWDRLRQLVEAVGHKLSLSALLEGARHSANRAGLVVCGGVAPAVAALRAKRALPAEIVELVRFASSERYLQLRLRRLGKSPA